MAAASTATRADANRSFFLYVKDPNTGVVQRLAFTGDVQVGLPGQPAELHLLGRLSLNGIVYTTDATNKGIINVSPNDTVVNVALGVTPPSGHITINLPPAPREGELHFVKDSTGTAGTVPIYVLPAQGYTIDGQALLTITTGFGSLVLIWLSGEWHVLIAGSGSSAGAPANLSFLTAVNEPLLPNHRRMVDGFGTIVTDSGPGTSFDYSVDPTVVAVLADNNVFTGKNVFEDQISGTLQQTAGGLAYIVPGSGISIATNSLGQVVVTNLGASSSSIYADLYAGYLVAHLDAENPQERVVVGAGGTTVTDGGARGNFTISSSLPPVQNIIGLGGTVVVFGQTTTVSSSIGLLSGTLTGLGGTKVIQQGSNYVFSSSIGPLSGAITGQGGTTVTQSGANLIISSSAPEFNNLYGTGGTKVTIIGDQAQVSSSIYADVSSSYLVVALDAENPNERRVVGSGSISVIDHGPGADFAISSSIYANASASYVVAGRDAENPNERVLTAGTGITFSDAGPGGNFTINSTGGTSTGATAAYYGYVTSSVWWQTTGSWAPFISALPDATVIDQISQSITRNNSDFRFGSTGFYAFHANFNAYGSDAYVSLRLNGVSSSKGIALERSTYRTTPADQNQVQLDGIFSASAGDILTLEYVTSGTTFPWTGSNPLPASGGPMHTGEIAISLLSSQPGVNINTTTGYFTQFTGTLNSLTASGGTNFPYGTWTNVASEQIYVTGSTSRIFIAYNVQSRRSVAGSNYAQICLDGTPLDYAALSFASGNPVLGNIGSFFVATASQGNHTVTLNVQADTNFMSIDYLGSFTSDHANLFVQEIPQITGQTLAGGATNGVGTYVNRPAAGNVGAQWTSLDGCVQFIDDGIQWRPVIGHCLGYQPPLSGSGNWSSIYYNDSFTSFTDDNGGLLFSASNFTNSNSTADFRMQVQPIPGSSNNPIFSATIHFRPMLPPNAQGLPFVSICFRNSGSGAVDQWGIYNGNPTTNVGTPANMALDRNWWTASDNSVRPTSFTNTSLLDFHIGSHTEAAVDGGIWLQMVYNGPAGWKAYNHSNDGRHWVTDSVVTSSSGFIPNQVGFAIGNIQPIDAGGQGGSVTTTLIFVDSWHVG